MNIDSIKVSLAPSAPAPTREVGAQPAPAALRGDLHPPAASAIEVSDSARLLRNVLDALILANAGNTDRLRSPPTQSALLSARSPALTPQLLPDLASISASSAPEMSAYLRQALEESGAFYEAHQSRWLQGQFDLGALRREPQARLAALSGPVTQPATAAAPGTAHASSPTGIAPAGVAAPDSLLKTAPGLEQVRLAAELDSAEPSVNTGAAGETARRDFGSAASLSASLIVPAPLLPVLEQQLHFLTAGELCWRGEAWPGQEVQWRLSNDRGGASDDAGAARVWSTTLRMHLPQLGSVEAQLRVSDAGVELRLLGEPHAVGQFAAAMPQLAQSFESAGIVLRSAQTKTHG